MKNVGYLIILTSFLCSRCASDSSLKPKIDLDQASINLMSELSPQLVGTWKMRQVHVKYQPDNYRQKQINLTKDTTFQEFATLIIQLASPARTNPKDLRRGEYNGTIQFQNKSYPVQFDLLANSGWLIDKKGPQASFSFSYNFPVGTRLTEPEEAFLENVGLMYEGYSLELVEGQQAMIWRGYNRGVDRIEMIKL